MTQSESNPESGTFENVGAGGPPVHDGGIGPDYAKYSAEDQDRSTSEARNTTEFQDSSDQCAAAPVRQAPCQHRQLQKCGLMVIHLPVPPDMDARRIHGYVERAYNEAVRPRYAGAERLDTWFAARGYRIMMLPVVGKEESFIELIHLQ